MTTLRIEPGQVLNERYRLTRLLGKGGMGQVFLSEDLDGGGQVALKTLLDVVDENDQRRFEREIRTLRTLSHPHIVPFRDVGTLVDHHLFYTMDYLAGTTLEEVLAERGPVTTTEELDWILRVAIQVAQALGYLHDRRLVHRDVKPSNILLSLPRRSPEELPPARSWPDEPGVIAQLTDFGLVKTRDDDGALSDAALGTPHYMSPEQVDASPAVDERSDLYSFGVILYRACTGKLPFQRLSEVISRDAAAPLRTHNPELPELLEELVARLLEYEPFRRPTGAAELIEMLRAVVDRRRGSDVEVPEVTKLTQPSFCGRHEELRQLKLATHQAARGEGQWVSVVGERGTGKSWLITRSDYRTSMRIEESVAFYSGSFAPSRPHSGFEEVVLAILKHIERTQGTARAVESLGRWGRHLLAIFPRLASEDWVDECPAVEEGVPSDILKERVFETVVGLITRYAELEPRVIVLENLHYGDEFDVELLRRVIVNALSLPILVITTHRQEFQTRVPSLERLLHEIRSEERILEIEMQPFAAEDARSMVSSMLVPARPLPDAFIDVLLERTDGVPLYLLHFMNSLWNRGLIQLAGDRWNVDPDEVRRLPIPESTRSNFLLVLDELPAEERRVLNVAAILGNEFSFDILHEAMEMDEFELDAICRNLAYGGIIEEHQDGFRFLHSFEQEIVISSLSAPMQRRLHARIGDLLEAHHQADRDSHLAEIAEHLYLGGQREKSFEYLRIAARQAEGRYAPRVALDLYTKALEVSPSDVERRDLLVSIGDLDQQLGDADGAHARYREARSLYAAARELAENGDRLPGPREAPELASYAKLLIRFGEVHNRLGAYDESLASLAQAEEICRRVEDLPGVAYAFTRQGATHVFREDFELAHRAYHAAVELYRNLPISAGHVSALTGISVVERMRGNSEKSLEYTNQALSIAEQMENQLQTAKLLNSYANLQRSMGRLHDARTSIERSIDIREKLGDRAGLAVCLMNLGRLRSDLGDFHASLQALTRARDLFQALGDRLGQLLILGHLSTLHFYRGDFPQAREYLDTYHEDAKRNGMLRAVGDALATRGILELEAGDLELSARLLEEGLECMREKGDRQEELRVQVQLARLEARRGNIEAARAMCEEVKEKAPGMENSESLAEAYRVLAEIHRQAGDLETAREEATRSLEVYEKLPLAYGQGTCFRTLGKIYRDLGFYWADQTGKFFDKSLRRFESLGARHALARTQLEFGTFLVLVEEFDGAVEFFTRARDTFAELGFDAERTRAARELAELTGEDPGGSS